MRIIRLYHPQDLRCGDSITLDKDSSQHLIKVLRTPESSSVTLFNGDGFDYQCTTLDTDHKHTGISVDKRTRRQTESPIVTTLFQGLSKHDRMETTIQKCVELGISQIVPVLFKRSNVRLDHDKRDKKLEHWRRVAISACEQSGRSTIPDISQITEPQDIGSMSSGIGTKLMLDPEARTALRDIDLKDDGLCYVIGPEGGLDGDELRMLDQAGFTGIRFGPRILRTETAGPAVLGAIQSLWGDCG